MSRGDRAEDSRSGTPLDDGHPRVAYIMSRFPKLTETFILYEILAMEGSGVRVELYPLLREREAIVQPEAVALVERAHYLPFISMAILRSQLHFLRRRPRAYLRALRDVIRGTWGSLNFLGGALGIFPKVAHAARLMAEDRITHVHCHFASHPAAAGFIIQRLTGITYSFTAHGSDLHVDRHMLCEKVAEAAFVVPISDYNRQLILTECGEQWRDKLVVIHCGVETSMFRPAERPRNQAFTIISVGTLHEVKGQTFLVEACRQLAEAGIDFVCRLIGDGADRAALVRQARDAGVGDRIRFEGQRTRGEIAEALRQSDVLVTPSVPTAGGKREGIPVVLMEAMSSGIPVVASELSGIPELVEDGVSGLLVPPRDATGLASALRRLHDEPQLGQRLGSAGREKVRREFDVATNAAALARRFTRVEAA
ncbi:MAG: glycosyltransferase [Candidatus Limnocylindria bacterium]